MCLAYQSGSKANLLDDTGKFIDDTLENNYKKGMWKTGIFWLPNYSLESST